jgi:hypothetical protein
VMPVGGGSLSLRVAQDTYLRARFDHAPYLWTVSSLEEAVAVSSFDVRLDRGSAGRWAGEAIYRYERFPEENVVRSLSGWILAPAYVSRDAGLRVGYAASRQDSDASTYRAAAATGRPPGPPGGPVPGVYDPYFTPEETRSHSVLLEGRGGRAAATSLRVTAAYAPWARELAPAAFSPPPTGGSAIVAFSERSFTPWSVRAQLTAAASAHTVLTIAAEHGRTAFYRISRVEASLEYRFVRSTAGVP